jgi:hypothetical protein
LSLIYALFQAYSKLLQIKIKIKFAKARSMLRKLAQAFSSKKNVDNFTKYLFNVFVFVFVFCICSSSKILVKFWDEKDLAQG